MNKRLPLTIWQSLPVAAVPAAPLVEASPDGDIRGIRGPVEIPPVQEWQNGLLAGFVVLLLIALLVWMYGYFKRRAARRVLSAREQALSDLDRAKELMSESSSRDYAYAVSDVLRGFLEVRFSMPTTRRTTDEFLQAITRNETALGPYKATLQDFLAYCDLGKFGKWQLSTNEMFALHQSATSVINAELDEPKRDADKESVPPAIVDPISMSA